MSPTLIALVAFAAWAALLVFGLANLRIVYARRTQQALNRFTPDGSDLEGLGQRWTRAHLNCLEFLPIAATVGLAAVVFRVSSRTRRHGASALSVAAMVGRWPEVRLLFSLCPLLLGMGLAYLEPLLEDEGGGT